jgi:NADH:ubiquinone oxidoreductase subunit D
MVINMGPQHPSTHGVLRLEIETYGEVLKSVVPHIGYLHRCFEKHCENLTWPQVIPYLDRLSKEGELGRKKITQYTRYGKVVLCLLQ